MKSVEIPVAYCINMLNLLELVNLTSMRIAQRLTSVGGGNWIASVHIRCGCQSIVHLRDKLKRARGSERKDCSLSWVGEEKLVIFNLRIGVRICCIVNICLRIGRKKGPDVELCFAFKYFFPELLYLYQPKIDFLSRCVFVSLAYSYVSNSSLFGVICIICFCLQARV